MSRDYIRRVVMSTDCTTRLIATATGFAEIIHRNYVPYPYGIVIYPTCGSPYNLAAPTLRAAYKLVKEGNPNY